MQNLPAVANIVNTAVSTVSNDERQRWEAEKNNLYMQLDDKVRGHGVCRRGQVIRSSVLRGNLIMVCVTFYEMSLKVKQQQLCSCMEL